MNFELKTLDLHAAATYKTDALIILVSTKEKTAKDTLSQLIADARKSGDLDESPAKLLSVWRPQGVSAQRVVLVSSGDGSARLVRQAVTAAVASLKAAKPAHITVCLTDPSAHRLQAAAQAVADTSYVYTATKPSAKASGLKRVVLALPTYEKTKAAKHEFDLACAQVAGVSLAKEWGNRPANHATPTHLADVAKALGKKAGIHCQVLGPKEIEKLGMGSFAAVARGSVEPLRFIVLQYSGAAKSEAPTVLVGKGITFDTGGISLKPGPGMDEMKFDMCGAASVLGTFEALAQLQPAINVVGLIVAWFQTADPFYTLIIGAIFMAGQFIEGNFLAPKMVGDSVGLHPLWTTALVYGLAVGVILLWRPAAFGQLLRSPALVADIFRRHRADGLEGIDPELAELVRARAPWIEKMRFVSSGTEATTAAIRLARPTSPPRQASSPRAVPRSVPGCAAMK